MYASIPPLRFAERIELRAMASSAGANLRPAAVNVSLQTGYPRRAINRCGCSGRIFETVVETLTESGEIKVWKAGNRVKIFRKVIGVPETADRQSAWRQNHFVGEYAVVYSRLAIALSAISVGSRRTQEGDGINVYNAGALLKGKTFALGFAGIIAAG